MRCLLEQMRAVSWFVLLVVALSLAARSARGDEPRGGDARVVIYAEGLDAERIAAALAPAVPSGVPIVDRAAYRRALTNAKHYGEMGQRLSEPSPAREQLFERVRTANRAVGAPVAVLARGRVRAGVRDVWVVVVDERSVVLEKGVPYEGDAPASEALRAAVAPSLEALSASDSGKTSATPSASAPEVPTAAPAVSTAPPVTVPPPRPPRDTTGHGQNAPASAVAPPRFVAGARVEIAGRSFGYLEPATRNLRPYSAQAIPVAGAHLEAYPVVFGRVGLGAIATFARSLAFDSKLEDGRTVSSSWTRLKAGMRLRLQASSALEVALTGRFGWIQSEFEEAGRFDDELPTTSYLFVRPGLDARVALGNVSFALDLGYSGVFASGAVAARFRETRVWGLDGEAYVAVAPVRRLELRLAGRYERLFYDFGSRTGDDFAAGAAYDQGFGVSLGPYLVF